MKDKKQTEMKEDILQDFNLDEESQNNEKCNCHDGCDCQHETCESHCKCEGNCTCTEDCDCDETHDCGCHGQGKHHCETANHKNCHCHDSGMNQHNENEYLLMAQRLQADFENYRRRVADQLTKERQEGVKDTVEVFLPCLDTFKEAKKSIADEGVLSGIKMIETKILEALGNLKVEKIEAVGKLFDPHFHNVIAAYADENKEDGIILEEFQSGWTMDGKVIRYSKVVVNKRG